VCSAPLLHINPAFCGAIQEYGIHISKFSLVPAEMPAYVELWRAVAPADRKDDI
jgi:hypothetical protein